MAKTVAQAKINSKITAVQHLLDGGNFTTLEAGKVGAKVAAATSHYAETQLVESKESLSYATNADMVSVYEEQIASLYTLIDLSDKLFDKAFGTGR